MRIAEANGNDPVSRPWYREPWPWVLIAVPLLSVVIASGITLWLALSHPDQTVVKDSEYDKIRAELRAQETDGPAVEPEPVDDPD